MFEMVRRAQNSAQPVHSLSKDCGNDRCSDFVPEATEMRFSGNEKQSGHGDGMPIWLNSGAFRATGAQARKAECSER